jgi:serine/threonine protein phosphatase PrpC
LKHSHFFSVCDGHGHNGQEVSGLLKKRLPYNIEVFFRRLLNTLSKEEVPDHEQMQ